ncbi:MAG: hypothetical protein ACOYEA_00585 [Fermentimonas sp.]
MICQHAFKQFSISLYSSIWHMYISYPAIREFVNHIPTFIHPIHIP